MEHVLRSGFLECLILSYLQGFVPRSTWKVEVYYSTWCTHPRLYFSLRQSAGPDLPKKRFNYFCICSIKEQVWGLTHLPLNYIHGPLCLFGLFPFGFGAIPGGFQGLPTRDLIQTFNLQINPLNSLLRPHTFSFCFLTCFCWGGWAKSGGVQGLFLNVLKSDSRLCWCAM